MKSVDEITATAEAVKGPLFVLRVHVTQAMYAVAELLRGVRPADEESAIRLGIIESACEALSGCALSGRSKEELKEIEDINTPPPKENQ
jgi:hypothetical protein